MAMCLGWTALHLGRRLVGPVCAAWLAMGWLPLVVSAAPNERLEAIASQLRPGSWLHNSATLIAPAAYACSTARSSAPQLAPFGLGRPSCGRLRPKVSACRRMA
jgi:hypothetical protein